MQPKALFVMILAVAMLLSITSLAPCVKAPALNNNGVVTTGVDDPSCGSCGRCSKCCQNVGNATYIGVRQGEESDGLWLTASHAVEGKKDVRVDYHPAEWVDGDLVIAEKDAACYGAPGAIGWVLMKTPGYVPCGVCPAEPSFDPICGKLELLYKNIGPCGTKCGTVNKCHTIASCACGQIDSRLFKTNTMADCYNCGVMAYDHCGRMIGLLVGTGKDCRPGQCNERYTTFLRLTPDMFKYIAGDSS